MALTVQDAAAFDGQVSDVPEGNPRVGEEAIRGGHEGPFDEKGHGGVAWAIKGDFSQQESPTRNPNPTPPIICTCILPCSKKCLKQYQKK